mmetsp:Transcript_23565/g.59442  ORF Transcript_23565/g.59442 Transcript_23565/m.59442 type:complete len:94 (-) Transcript_23565:891-1172(-)
MGRTASSLLAIAGRAAITTFFFRLRRTFLFHLFHDSLQIQYFPLHSLPAFTNYVRGNEETGLFSISTKDESMYAFSIAVLHSTSRSSFSSFCL